MDRWLGELWITRCIQIESAMVMILSIKYYALYKLNMYVFLISRSDHQRIQQEFYENKVGRDVELPQPFHWSKW